jgi:hypothetical protein
MGDAMRLLATALKTGSQPPERLNARWWRQAPSHLSKNRKMHWDQERKSLSEQNRGGSGKLLAEGGNSELRMDGVTGAPFFIAQPVRILEDNFSIDSNQNGSPKEVSSGFRANVCVLSLEQFRSI